MSGPTEVKEFVLEEDDAVAFGVSPDKPDHFAFLAQDSEGKRRIVYIPHDPYVAANLAIQICELAGIRKLHHKVTKGNWDIQYGPRP